MCSRNVFVKGEELVKLVNAFNDDEVYMELDD
jgi:hypothetical protein